MTAVSLTSAQRWRALVTLCLGVLLIAINATIVNVALPAIRLDLSFSESSLSWVASIYLTTYAGCLLLGGRLGDFFGPRPMFLGGIAVFTVASLACGVASSREMLLVARAAQGIGAAVVIPVALSLVTSLFPGESVRARALGIYGFVAAGGGTIGLFLGGLVLSVLSWRWLFLLSVPLGICVHAISMISLPKRTTQMHSGRLDTWGALTITSAMMLAVFAIVNAHQAGWLSSRTLLTLGLAIALGIVFFRLEARASTPLVPMALLRVRNLAVANSAGALLAAAILAWAFLSALYLQRVMYLTPFEVSLALVPANLIIALMSLGIAPRIVARYGLKPPLVIGLLVACAGLSLLGWMPGAPSLYFHVLPALLLVGLGVGLAYNPLLVGALSGISSGDSGAGSGIFNTAYTMSGALGVSALASIAAARTEHLMASGEAFAAALGSGYSLAFSISAALVALAAVISAFIATSSSA